MPQRLANVLVAVASIGITLVGIGNDNLVGAWVQSTPPTVSSRYRLASTRMNAYLDDGSSPVNGSRQSQQSQPPSSTNDFTGAGTLGDIMSRDTEQSGLVTTDGGLLAKKFGIHSPLDRMALTANGNLQRLFSSYYDAPVHVVVDTCHPTLPQEWNRVVHLTVHDTTFCTAKSRIILHDDKCRELVESGQVGLGQLFRYLDKLPSFSLLQAGYCDEGGLWREYTLECKELTCHIEETFLPEMWNIVPKE